MTTPADAAPDLTRWPAREGVTERHGPGLVAWAVAPEGTRPRTVLLRGQHGSGKSQLLAWFLTGAAAHTATTVHALVPAEGLYAETFSWELGRQLGYGPVSAYALLERLAHDGRPLLLLVADLHRAGAGPADRPAARPATLVEELLSPLLRLPFVRAVVEVGDMGPLDGLDDAGAVDLEGGGATEAAPRAGAPALGDPGALLREPAATVTAFLADERVAAPHGLREAWAIAAPQLTDGAHDMATRAALLHAAALSDSAQWTAPVASLAAGLSYRAVWTRRGTAPTALAALPGAPGRLLAAEPARGLRVVTAATGADADLFGGARATCTVIGVAAARGAEAGAAEALLLTADGTLLTAEACAALAVPAAEETAVGGRFAAIAAWHGRSTLGAGFPGPDGPGTALPGAGPRVTAVGSCTDGSVAAVGDDRGAVHVWAEERDGHGGQDVPVSRVLHGAPVTAVACVRGPGGGPVLVAGAGMDGVVRLWAASAEPMAEPVERRRAVPMAMCAAWDGDPVLAVAWSDLRLHLWHLPTGRLRAVPLLSPCHAIAFSASPERRPLLVAAGAHGTTAWELDLPELWG